MDATCRYYCLLPIPACFLSLSLLMVSAGCRGLPSSASSDPPPTKTLTSLAVSPSSTSLAIGGTQQFTATGKYSDGSTANISSTATWTIADAAVATVNPSGLATALASG